MSLLSTLFFFNQETAYVLRISDWSSDVCSSNLSNRSTSPIVQPALARTLLIAPTGATVKSFGSCACAACAMSRATGFAPFASATDWRVSTTAAAPSEIDEQVAAVIVPYLAKAGRSVGILSGLPLAGCTAEIGRAQVCTPVTTAHLICRHQTET